LFQNVSNAPRGHSCASQRHAFRMHYLSLPLKNEIVVYMEVSFIIAVALATVVMLIVIGLFVALMYYRWRTSELMSGISDYIRKNWKMEQRIKQLERNTNHI